MEDFSDADVNVQSAERHTTWGFIDNSTKFDSKETVEEGPD